LTMPGWFWRWRDAVTAYMQYAPLPPPHIQLLFGKWIGTMLGAAVLLGVGVFCWKARKDSVQSDRFLLAGPLILTASLVLSPVWHPYDQILLLPAALLGFCWRHEIAKMSAPRQLVVILSGIIVSWQWISALALSLTAIVSPNLAQGWQILPWISIVLSPTFVLVSLALIGRARLSAADLG